MDAHSAEIRQAAVRNRLSKVRVFGSCATGADTPDSDVDLLVHAPMGVTLLDVAGFQAEAEDILGIPVDVITDGSSGYGMARILTEEASRKLLSGRLFAPAFR
ncbi:nucleotidyltransferase domain-containing protein [Paenarthrobacter sp. PH39-S1]|uniref:nucleotidyltransferase family protein n=1 Tax=Paenarthrobacter sp. PH39-S1 TaxID=3046204 RepID=UPI0024BB14D5|nr:nucleotidyltransferase domain-containing protein [Paenarthrobacter sp. PH39-S1]MDJ0355409.1 nucleotidyltransferase domain-containing protein [Paenarthrobacter sp. PH39-S1]